jgi:hypothetical protein
MAGPSAGSGRASSSNGEGWGGESVDKAVDNLAGDVDNGAVGGEKRAVGVEKGT